MTLSGLWRSLNTFALCKGLETPAAQPPMLWEHSAGPGEFRRRDCVSLDRSGLNLLTDLVDAVQHVVDLAADQRISRGRGTSERRSGSGILDRTISGISA